MRFPQPPQLGADMEIRDADSHPALHVVVSKTQLIVTPVYRAVLPI